MGALGVWLGAALLYAAFRVWYDGWRRPLRPEEVERFLAAMPGLPGAVGNDEGVMRRFLEADDGREFFMLNLVRLAPGEVPHPRTGEAVRAEALMREYVRGFLPALVRRGGHPALHARRIGGYVDAWNVPDDPGWTLVGLMRYRSRRDMVELALDPRFVAAHPFKHAAIPVTASFPTSPRLLLLAGPRVWVGLVLALGAALLT